MRILLALLLTAACGFPQKVSSVLAGMLYYSEARVVVDGVESAPTAEGEKPRALDRGQTVDSPAGHAEFLMGPASVMWMRAGSRVRFDDTSLTVGRVTLLEGSIMVEIKRTEKDRLLTVQVGGRDISLPKAGLFRFDADPWRVRVVSGWAQVNQTGEPLRSGEQATTEGVREFDLDDAGEFHYWAAYRSLTLEIESGKHLTWNFSKQEATHLGFGISYPLRERAAYLKYLAAGEAGLLFATMDSGNSRRSRDLAQSLIPIGEGNTLVTDRRFAEVFLGIGATVRVNPGARLRIVDSNPHAPVIRLESGQAVVEVGDDAHTPRPRVQVGETVTELRQSGIYEFDAANQMLWVHGGETETWLGESKIRGRRGESLRLTDLSSSPRFEEAGRYSELVHWTKLRSYLLFAEGGDFMTIWKDSISWFSGRRSTSHQVFGPRERQFSAPRTFPTVQAVRNSTVSALEHFPDSLGKVRIQIEGAARSGSPDVAQ